MSLLPTALRYLRAGVSIIPCNVTTKAPTINSWKSFMGKRPSPKDLVKWFGDDKNTALAVIGGEVSGNLEIMDFDAPELFPRWAASVSRKDSKLLNRLVMSRTQSGGYHVYYRTDSVGRNTKIARSEDRKTLIETRGIGGYVIAPPSQRYAWFNLSLESIPVINKEERNLLFISAEQFNFEEEEIDAFPPQIQHKENVGTRPGDLYNAAGNISSVLIKHGWRYIYNRAETQYWCRPGKEFGISATFNYKGCNKFYVFSSNAYPFAPGHTYSPFAVYTLLEWQGNWKIAAADLANRGFCTVSD